mgnify:CR=1 FL=1
MHELNSSSNHGLTKSTHCTFDYNTGFMNSIMVGNREGKSTPNSSSRQTC